jgi:hypothetical protein
MSQLLKRRRPVQRSGARLSDTGLQERPVDQTGLALDLTDFQHGLDGQSLIPLGISLRYRGSGMAKHRSGYVDIEFTAEERCGIVAEPVRMPIRHSRQLAAIGYGSPIGGGIVTLSRSFLRLSFPPVSLRGLNGSFSIPPLLGSPLGHRLRR